MSISSGDTPSFSASSLSLSPNSLINQLSIQKPRNTCISGFHALLMTDGYDGRNACGSKYCSVYISIVELVPKDIDALSGLATERPSVSQALSAPVAMSGSPSGAPVSAAASFVMQPRTSPEGMSS